MHAPRAFGPLSHDVSWEGPGHWRSWIRDGDLPSSARVKDMDLSLVNVRSFRRSATQAMRKAGVDPELVEYIQQWKHRGNSSDMRMHYDSVDAADTMGAMRGV